MKDFGKDAIKGGLRTFMIDLKECPEVDSTFMGILAFFALRLLELREGGVCILNANTTVAESFQHLGLDQLMEFKPNE